ncbi:MAG: DUF2007 domain-containing protein [Armatimonadetes bacterium]|nr:DUF2007 domain-containing protein [Armatimonadota bacterium]
MFCPQCQYEFKEGIAVCPDCRVPLLVELPSKPKLQPKPMTKDVDVEAVLSTCDPVVLALAKSRLDEADIPYLVKNEELVYGVRVGIEQMTPQIWVRKNDLEEARQLLHDLLIDA